MPLFIKLIGRIVFLIKKQHIDQFLLTKSLDLVNRSNYVFYKKITFYLDLIIA